MDSCVGLLRVSIATLPHPDSQQLLTCIERALAAMVEAGWSEEFKPKMHWTLHFPDSLKNHQHLVAC